MQAELDRDARRQIGDIYGAGMQQAFAQAQRGLDLDRAYADQAARLGQSAYQNPLAGDAQRIQGAGILGDFVDQRRRMEIDRLRQHGRRWQKRKRLPTGLADARVSGLLASKSVPQEAIDTYSRILQGPPANPGQTQTAFGVGPSTLQQLLGSGIAAAGLYNAFRGPQV